MSHELGFALVRLYVGLVRGDKDVMHGFSAEEHFITHFLTIGQSDVNIPSSSANGNRGSYDVSELCLTIGAGDFSIVDDFTFAFYDSFRVAFVRACLKLHITRAIFLEGLYIEGMKA